MWALLFDAAGIDFLETIGYLVLLMLAAAGFDILYHIIVMLVPDIKLLGFSLRGAVIDLLHPLEIDLDRLIKEQQNNLKKEEKGFVKFFRDRWDSVTMSVQVLAVLVFKVVEQYIPHAIANAIYSSQSETDKKISAVAIEQAHIQREIDKTNLALLQEEIFIDTTFRQMTETYANDAARNAYKQAVDRVEGDLATAQANLNKAIATNATAINGLTKYTVPTIQGEIAKQATQQNQDYNNALTQAKADAQNAYDKSVAYTASVQAALTASATQNRVVIEQELKKAVQTQSEALSNLQTLTGTQLSTTVSQLDRELSDNAIAQATATGSAVSGIDTVLKTLRDCCDNANSQLNDNVLPYMSDLKKWLGLLSKAETLISEAALVAFFGQAIIAPKSAANEVETSLTDAYHAATTLLDALFTL